MAYQDVAEVNVIFMLQEIWSILLPFKDVSFHILRVHIYKSMQPVGFGIS